MPLLTGPLPPATKPATAPQPFAPEPAPGAMPEQVSAQSSRRTELPVSKFDEALEQAEQAENTAASPGEQPATAAEPATEDGKPVPPLPGETPVDALPAMAAPVAELLPFLSVITGGQITAVPSGLSGRLPAPDGGIPEAPPIPPPRTGLEPAGPERAASKPVGPELVGFKSIGAEPTGLQSIGPAQADTAQNMPLPLPLSAGGQRLLAELPVGVNPAWLSTPATELPAQTPTPASAPALAPTLPAIPIPLTSSAWSQAMAQRVILAFDNDLQRAEIQITPPHLGPIDLQISLQQDKATVHFISPHHLTRDALEAALPKLQDLLREQGINLADAQVRDRSLTGGQGEHAREQGKGPWANTPEEDGAERIGPARIGLPFRSVHQIDEFA